jgi:hypothetical protein
LFRVQVKVAIATDTCLNNHDFSVVDCGTLQGCVQQVDAQGVLQYADLVACTGAPAMSLSNASHVPFLFR